MLMRIVLFAMSLTVLFTGSVPAQEIGNRIVVTAANAQLESRTESVGSVPKGTILTVEDVTDESFCVVFWGAKKATRSWIKRSDVIPLNEALDFFNNELLHNPTADGYAIRGALRSENREYDKAIADFDEVIRIDRRRGTTFRYRGNVWTAKHDYDKALADFNEAIRLDPTDARNYVSRGRALAEIREYDQAVGDFDMAVRLDPLNPIIRCHRGLCRGDNKEYDKAIADY